MNQPNEGGMGGRTLGDANGLDPQDKSQTMEVDLVGALMGKKRGRECELGEEKMSGVGGW